MSNIFFYLFRNLDNVSVARTIPAMKPYQSEYCPKNWKPARWAAYLERKAEAADESHPDIAGFMRHWAFNVREIAAKRLAKPVTGRSSSK